MPARTRDQIIAYHEQSLGHFDWILHYFQRIHELYVGSHPEMAETVEQFAAPIAQLKEAWVAFRRERM